MKIFEFDSEYGLANKVDGSVLTNLSTRFVKTHKGLAGEFNGTTSGLALSVPVTLNFASGTFEIVCAVKIKRPSNNICLADSSSNTLYIKWAGVLASTIVTASGTYSFTSILPKVNQWTFLSISATGGQTTIRDLTNGTSQTASVGGSFNLNSIGKRLTTSDNMLGNISFVKVFDNVLTTTERNNEYKQFLNRNGLSLGKRNFYYSKSVQLRETGLVGAWNMQKSGNKVYDISGNNNDGTIVNCIPTNNGLMGLGHNSTSSIGLTSTIIIVTGNPWTVNFVINNYMPGATNDWLIGGTNTDNIFLKRITTLGYRASDFTYYGWDGTGNTQSILSSDLANGKQIITMTCDGTNIYTYWNGVYKGYITPTTTRIVISNIMRGYGSSTWTPKVELIDCRIYNRVLTLQEIKNYNNQFAKRHYIKDCFCDLNCDGNTVVPKDWIRGTGAYKGVVYTYNPAEILSNSDFDTGITEWGKMSGDETATISWNSGLKALNLAVTVAGTKDIRPALSIAMNITAFKRYTVTIDYVVNSGTCVLARSFNGTSTVSLNQTLTGAGSYTFTLLFVTSPSPLILYFDGTNTFDVDFTRISVKEIPETIIKPGQKYLQCTTAGTYALPSQWAYGTCEFSLYKGDGANTSYFYPISSSFPAGNGYLTGIGALENTFIASVLNGAGTLRLASASSYLAINTWYRFRITRTTDGVFTLYIKGGTFTDWTLVSTIDGIGTNPVTNSTYTKSSWAVLDFDVGDRFADLSMTEGIVV